MNEGKIVGYGILGRHPGFIDNLLPQQQDTWYAVDDINHWWNGNGEPLQFEDEASAKILLELLVEKFGGQKYGFTLAVLRLEPRWFIADPKNERERLPIGSREQL